MNTNTNNNPFGVAIPTDDDLMTATTITKREILEAGIYYATISGMEFKISNKSNLPMLAVSFNIINETTNNVISILDHWMLASASESKPSIYYKLAGLFECWSVPKELRGTKYFTWMPSQAGQDPAQKLFECIKNYAKVSPINTSYVSRLMVRLSIDKEENTYTNNQGQVVHGFKNSIKVFIPLDGAKEQPQQSQQREEVDPFAQYFPNKN